MLKQLSTVTALAMAFLIVAAGSTGAATITIVNNDSAGEGFNDPEILQISAKVSCKLDPEYGSGLATPWVRPALELKLKDGRVLRADKRTLRYGHPQNPMSEEENFEKFKDCMSFSVNPKHKERTDELYQMLTNLEEVDDVNKIIKMVS